jgi:hypothetical protein
MTQHFNIAPLGAKVAASFTGGGANMLQRAASGMHPGASDHYGCFWVLLNTLSPTPSYGGIFGVEWLWGLQYDKAAQDFWFTGLDSTSSAFSVHSATISANVWYFVEIERVGTTIRIAATPESSSTRSAYVSTAIASGSLNTTFGNRRFGIGAKWDNSNALVARLDGAVDEAYYWITTVPTEDERDDIFNGGAGISRGEFLDLGITMPTNAWALEEVSGTRYDWVGDKHLSQSGTVGTTTGHIDTTDFTSLEAAYAYAVANFDGSEPWVFNCWGGESILYSGLNFDDLGTDPTNNITIQGVPGQDAFIDDYLNVYSSNFIFQDMRVVGPSSYLSLIADTGSISNLLVQRCSFERSIAYVQSIDDIDNIKIINNFFEPDDVSYGIYIFMYSSGVNVQLTDLAIEHNTILGKADENHWGIYVEGIEESGGECFIAGHIKNNVMLLCDLGSIYRTGVTNDSILTVKNIATDTETDIQIAEPGDAFENLDSIPSPILSSAAYRTGASSDVDEDYYGNPRNNPPDIGAVENQSIIPPDPPELSDAFTPAWIGIGIRLC